MKTEVGWVGAGVMGSLSWMVCLAVVSKQIWCLTSTETVQLIGDVEKGGRGYGGGGRGSTVTTRMTSALRWAAMRAILMFQ